MEGAVFVSVTARVFKKGNVREAMGEQRESVRVRVRERPSECVCACVRVCMLLSKNDGTGRQLSGLSTLFTFRMHEHALPRE
jgi:hypothetical protein